MFLALGRGDAMKYWFDEDEVERFFIWLLIGLGWVYLLGQLVRGCVE